MARTTGKSILFELLRSYISLAETLNLSATVRILGSTRQTVRRHIDILEDARGEKLFELNDRQYRLTKAGMRSLNIARSILANGEAWMSGQFSRIGGLEHIHYENSDYFYYSQQHRLQKLFAGGSPLLKCGFECWSNAETYIENAAFQEIRPYLVVYRRQKEEWLRIEVGEKSSFATWYGWAWAKSNLGHTIMKSTDEISLDRVILHAYLEVYENSGVRFDHVLRTQNRLEDDKIFPVSFQRLLLGCTFPDGSPALAVLVVRTHDVQIDGLEQEQIGSMPKEFLTDISQFSK